MFLFFNDDVAEIWPLYTRAGLNLRDGVLGEVERNSFLALPGKGGHVELMPSRLCVSHPGASSEEFYSARGAGRDKLVDALLIGWW